MSKDVSNYDFVVVLISRAIELAKKGLIDEAIHILNKAVELADAIEDIPNKFSAFLQLARAYMFVGDKEKARELLESINEELGEKEFTEYTLYRLIIRIEKIRLKVEYPSDLKKELEDIRHRFEDLISGSGGNRDVLRYYLAFIIIIWAPEMAEIDIEYVEKTLREIVERHKCLQSDPQYAELLTLLAEIHVKMGKEEQALEELKEALRIYSGNASYSGEAIRDILLFARKYLPTKYGEILNYLRDNTSASSG